MNRWNRPGFPARVEVAFGLAVVAFAAACAGPPERNDPPAPASPAATGGAAAGASDAQSARASPSVRRMRGMYALMADTGSFVDCHSGQRLVVATEADNAALERAYLQARAEPGSPVLAAVDGHVVSRVFMEGPKRPMLVVERFVELRSGHDCDGPVAPASRR